MIPAEWTEALGEETERVERKESDRDVEDILRAACALANDLGNSGRPGYVALGISDAGKVVGVDVSDESIQRLVNRLRSTKIPPNPSITIEATLREGRGVLVVRVEPYPVPPVVRVDEGAWVRVGTTTRRATEADLLRLQERRPENRLPFDQRPVHGAALEDLNEIALGDDYAALRSADRESETYPSLESWLTQREVLRKVGECWVPTAAGVLVHGLEPHKHIPAAILEFVRYAGTDFDAPVVVRKTITGSLPTQLDALWAQLQAHTTDLPGQVEGVRSPFYPEYPLETLKELARNMVQHRLYEGTNAPGRISWLQDRIVFNNPGHPYGRATEGEFGENSDYRNPTLTRFLVERGYVERLGRGILLARKALAKNGNPPLEIETNGFTSVTVRKRS